MTYRNRKHHEQQPSLSATATVFQPTGTNAEFVELSDEPRAIATLSCGGHLPDSWVVVGPLEFRRAPIVGEHYVFEALRMLFDLQSMYRGGWHGAAVVDRDSPLRDWLAFGTGQVTTRLMSRDATCVPVLPRSGVRLSAAIAMPLIRAGILAHSSPAELSIAMDLDRGELEQITAAVRQLHAA